MTIKISYKNAHDIRRVVNGYKPTATKLSPVWDYKTAGFGRFSDAVAAFNTDFGFLNNPSRQKSKGAIRASFETRLFNGGSSYDHPRQGRILNLLAKKIADEKADGEWLATIINADTISGVQSAITDSVKNETQDCYGEWACAGIALSDGRMLVATFSTDTEWVGKNDKWPHKTRSTKVQIFSAPRIVESTHHVSSRAGNWIQKAAIELLKPRSGKANNINLDKKIRAKCAGSRMGIKFYQRTIAGIPLDYVAVIGKTTFHAETKKTAMSGLAAKIKGKSRNGRGSKLNFEICRDLGFCKTGIAEFCDTFGLNLNKSYSRKRIASLIDGDSRADIYQHELKKAGVI